METNIGRCAEHLRKMVQYFAVSSGTCKEKLAGMLNVNNNGGAGFLSIYKDDFPNGPLREAFQSIKASLSSDHQPQVADNIEAMTDEEARMVIEKICELADDVATAWGESHRTTAPTCSKSARVPDNFFDST
jgi:hypothetical protein